MDNHTGPDDHTTALIGPQSSAHTEDCSCWMNLNANLWSGTERNDILFLSLQNSSLAKTLAVTMSQSDSLNVIADFELLVIINSRDLKIYNSVVDENVISKYNFATL